MSDLADLDRLIAPHIRDFELGQLRRQQLSVIEREKMLDETLGAKTPPAASETFAIGDSAAGITAKSVWFEFRRIHFATIISIAVGEVAEGKRFKYGIDVNCTLRRSFRIALPTIPEADNFLVALCQFMSFKIVPTVEDELREQRHAEELAAASEANADRRQRRMESLSLRQQQLLNELIQVECAPRISFGVVY